MTTNRAILTALDRVKPFILPEMSLWTDVNAAMGRPITLTELRARVTELEGARMVVAVTQDEQIKWRISAMGEAELKS